jgi:hypothetical protein
VSSIIADRFAAMNAAGWCALHYAVWYAISAYAAACDLLKP